MGRPAAPASGAEPAAAAPMQLLLADAELAGARWAGADLILRLAAASVLAAGQPAGLALGLDWTLEGLDPAAAAGLPPLDAFFGRLRGVRLGGAGRWHGSLPLPGRLDGPLAIELTLPQGPELLLRAAATTLSSPGPLRLRESWAC